MNQIQKKLIGTSVKRLEDKRFVSGKGQYTDDIKLHGMTFVSFVRSDIPHGIIKKINVDAVKSMPGVVAVFTGEDLQKDNIVGVPTGWQVNFINGDVMKEPPHPILALGKVRYVGDAVAAVIAESRDEAADAAEAMEIEYEELPGVASGSNALAADAPQLFDSVPNNRIFDWQLGDEAKTDEALNNSDKVVTFKHANQRLSPNAIEPRCAIGDYNASRDHYTLYTSTQNPHLIRLLMSAFVLAIPEQRVRIVSPDVGGGFGSKIFHYIEEAFVSWASKKINRPVKWTSTRTEAFLTDCHGRDHETVAKMGFTNDGKITALKVGVVANLGAYLSTFAPAVPTYLFGTLLQGVYTTPAIHVKVDGVVTSTVPVDAYRGAGRPEASYLIERLVDLGALELGMDPVDLRMKNFIPAFDGVDQPGYQTEVALQYDSGDYENTFKKLIEFMNYKELRDKQKAQAGSTKLLGIGFSCYIEACGIAPSAVVGALGARAGLYESGGIRVQPTGKVSVMTGSQQHGQGHETTFAQIVSDQLGIPIEDIEILHGDSDQTAFGMGTYGSRSLAVGGSAIVKAGEKVLEKGAKIAAHLLEASESDLEFSSGSWTVKGTDKSITFQQVALTAYVPHNFPAGLEPGLEALSFYDPVNFTYPFGSYAAFVEVDTETGKVTIKDFFACDDVGNVVNPLIVEGQIHGGVAQGIGQALLEEVIYDDAGNMQNPSYMDYAMPKADDLPSYKTTGTVTPCPHNPLGVKGAGEAGTIGSAQAVVNAVCDALKSYGIKDIQMPLSPQKVWKAIQNAKSN